jgi:Zn finger protein HypA/HybF involved in hydrogenase expression
MTEQNCVTNASEFHIPYMPIMIRCPKCGTEFLYTVELFKEFKCPFCGAKLNVSTYLTINICIGGG